MQRWYWVTLTMAVSCGGAQPPAESPEDESLASPSEAPASEPASRDETDEASDDAEEEPSREASPARLGDDDVETILQRVIDDEEITGYLRLGEAGRLPLKVKGDVIPSGAKLVKGADVVVVDEVGDGDAVLEFTEVNTVGDKVTVRFRFDEEGVKGAVTLHQGLRGWEILRSRITQR